eukprot:1151995-Pelagomonas_calceolata.AAC.1
MQSCSMLIKTHFCIKIFRRTGSSCVLGCSKWGNVVKMGIFQPIPLCQTYSQMCSSDIADTIATGMGLIGGLAGLGWAGTSEVVG